jgi:hypothetical protein
MLRERARDLEPHADGSDLDDGWSDYEELREVAGSGD